jgi:hypothetical protein
MVLHPTVSVVIHWDLVTMKAKEHMESLFHPAVTRIKLEPSCTNWCIELGSTMNTLDPTATHTLMSFGIKFLMVGSINITSVNLNRPAIKMWKRWRICYLLIILFPFILFKSDWKAQYQIAEGSSLLLSYDYGQLEFRFISFSWIRVQFCY